MATKNSEIKDRILEIALNDVEFEGWNWDVIENAAIEAGFEKEMATAVFPEKIEDVIIHFSDWADRKMLETLNSQDFSGVRIRDKVQAAVWERLKILKPHKEAVRKAAAYWVGPTKTPKAAKTLWNSADLIWEWVGDTSEDYNFYTKRGLLVGVMSATTLRWINDQSEDHEDTRAFLARRIDNVLKIGQKAGKVLGKLSPLLEKFPNWQKKSDH
ncbi:MAG: COQ9 family protein [Pseudomonadota bacterium]